MSLANETTLSNRREPLCHKFMAEMTDTRDHHYRSWCPPLYKELILITLDLVLLDHSISSRELRDQRTFLLLNIRRLSIRHDYLFK